MDISKICILACTIIGLNLQVRRSEGSGPAPACHVESNRAECLNFHNVPKAKDVAGSESITVMVLEGNYIKQLHSEMFTPYPKLTELLLQNNQMASINPQAFKGLTSLTVQLNLSSNNLTAISDGVFSSDLQRLKTLNLDSNKLTKISQHMLDNLTSLETLNIQNNSLSSIHGHAFNKLKKLQYLHIQHNRLTQPSSAWFSGLTLMKTADLGFNPWKCDCSIKLFKTWMSNNDLFPQSIKLICAAPIDIANQNLRDVTADKLICSKSLPTSPGNSVPTESKSGSSAAAAVISILVIAVVATVIGVWWFRKKRGNYEGLLSNPSSFEPTLDDVRQSEPNYTQNSEAYI